MATITPKPTPTTEKRTLATSHQSVRSPLHALRGKIRRYVIFESMTSLLVSLAIAFWVLIALDLGSYLAFGFDWVESFPTWFRAIILGLAVGLVGFFVELYKVAKLKKVDIDAGTQSRSFFERVGESPAMLFGLVIPAGLLYLAGWVVLGVLRDDGDLGGAVLGWCLAGGLVVFAAALVIRRMMYDFRELSLAMVLERRFPEELGDRLLTAIELRDPRKVEEYGYSSEMVTHVIHQAAERVDKLNPSSVFDWPRLYWRGIWCVLLTVGGFLLATGTVTAIAAQGKGIAKEKPVVWSLNQFNDASLVWFKRSVLLEETRWPQKILMEMQHPLDEPFYVGRSDDNVQKKLDKANLLVLPPKKKFANRYLRARAMKWIVRDTYVEGNWRPLEWRDLSEDVLETSVPTLDLSGDSWKWLDASRPRRAPRDARGREELIPYVPIDELEVRVQKGGELADAPEAAAIRNVVDRLNEHVEMHPLSLKVRRLQVPKTILVKFEDSNNPEPKEMQLENAISREYSLVVPNLNEDSCPYYFIANGQRTEAGTIETLPNPNVAEARAEKLVPAYHFYDVSGTWPFNKYLSGLKQNRESTDQPRVYQGGTISLFRKMTRRITPGTLLIDAQSEDHNVKPVLDSTMDDAQTLKFTLRDVQKKVTIRYAFQDEHGLYGYDEIRVDVDSDQPPHRVGRDEQISVKPTRLLRNLGGSTYRVTPEAILPFQFDVEDDYGLYALDYRYRVKQVVSKADMTRRLAQVAGAVGMGTSNAMGGQLSDGVYRWGMDVILKHLRERQGIVPVPRVRTALTEQRARWQGQDIEALLQNPKTELKPLFKVLSVKDPLRWTDRNSDLDAYLRDPEYSMVLLDPERGDRRARENLTGLDLKSALPFLKAGEKQVQRTYVLTVWVEAIDNNVDSPARGSNPSAEWTFMVVPAVDLLRDIRKEELEQFAKLEEVYLKLSKEYERMTRDVKVLGDALPVKDEKDRPIKDPEAPLVVIADGMQMPAILSETSKKTLEVHDRYYELFLEMRTNRIDPNITTATWKNVIVPLSDSPDADTVQQNRAVRILIDETNEQIRKFRLALLDPTVADVNVRRENARKEGQLTLNEVEKLMDAMQLIMDRIRGITDRKKITEMLQKIYNDQLIQVERIKEQKEILEKDLLKGALEDLKGLEDPKK